MDAANQYELKVQNGKVQSEEGSFFKAIKFNIQSEGRTVDVDFNKAKGGHHDVVYKIEENGELKAEWTHPDYVPEVTPGQYPDPATLPKEDWFIYAAFAQLGISRDKDFVGFFSKPENLDGVSYFVSQPKLG